MFNQNELETELSAGKQRIQSPPQETKAYIRRGWLNLNSDKLPSFSPSSTPPKNSTRALYLTCGRADFPTTTPPDWLPGAKQFKIDLTVNGKDLEETVWRYLCIVK
jgi:hypothetical protein